MSFFDPVLPPLMEEGSAPIIRRAFQRAKIVGNFVIVQAVVQIIGFLSGILLVRTLEQREYAYFTIANTMQGTINLLADIGISVGLVSIGGRVWQDRHRFGQLISTALSVRKKLGAVAIIIVTPVLYFLLVKNGASFFYTAVLIAVVLAGLLIQLSLGVLDVVPRLRSDIARIQTIDLTGAIARLLVLVTLMYFFSMPASPSPSPRRRCSCNTPCSESAWLVSSIWALRKTPRIAPPWLVLFENSPPMLFSIVCRDRSRFFSSASSPVARARSPKWARSGDWR